MKTMIKIIVLLLMLAGICTASELLLESKNKAALEVVENILSKTDLNRIAVLSFQYDIENEFTKFLESSLIKSGQFTVVERNDLDFIHEESSKQNTLEFDIHETVKTGKMIGAELIVSGEIISYSEFMGVASCNVSVKCIDVETAKIVYADRVSVTAKNIFGRNRLYLLLLVLALILFLSLFNTAGKNKIDKNIDAQKNIIKEVEESINICGTRFKNIKKYLLENNRRNAITKVREQIKRFDMIKTKFSTLSKEYIKYDASKEIRQLNKDLSSVNDLIKKHVMNLDIINNNLGDIEKVEIVLDQISINTQQIIDKLNIIRNKHLKIS